MTLGLTRSIAGWVAGVDVGAVPAAVLDSARAGILDAFGCASAGARTAPLQALREAMLAGETGGPGRAWFGTRRCSLWTEAFVNASLVHALDYDDAHRASKTHPGAAVIPAALAAAREPGTDLADVLAGIVTGYEVTLRLGSAVGVAAHRARGWHATSTCGTVGAAAAASRVLRLDAEQTASALGHGATQAAGLWAFSTDGAMNKKSHPGHAARAGLGAAHLARAGVTGSAVGLEAEDGGFLPAFAPDRSPADWLPVLSSLGESWWLPEVARKPYPCCRTAHTAIDAARELRADGLRVEDIREVEVQTYQVGVDQCGFHDPANGTQAAFSTPYVVACAFRDGWVGPEHFAEECVADPDLRELHRRIRVTCAPDLERQFPAVWPARVRVTCHSGPVAERGVSVALGDPAAPMSADQVEAKLAACLDADQDVAELSDRILGLPATGPAAELLDLLDGWPR